MSIILVGLPGAGKSTVGALLAAELGLEFIDVDQHIEQQTGMPVTAIFAQHGEEHFRRLEEQATLQLIQTEAVVSPGGGAVLNPRIREALADHDVVWLEVSPAVAAARVGEDGTRPLLNGDVDQRLEALQAERVPLYQAVAGTRVLTDTADAAGIAAQLAATRRPS